MSTKAWECGMRADAAQDRQNEADQLQQLYRARYLRLLDCACKSQALLRRAERLTATTGLALDETMKRFPTPSL